MISQAASSHPVRVVSDDCPRASCGCVCGVGRRMCHRRHHHRRPPLTKNARRVQADGRREETSKQKGTPMGHKKGDPGQKAMAAYMKDRGIKRTTGQCPWGCGSPISLGGSALIAHLGRCQGGGAKKRARLTSFESRRRAA